MFLDDLFWLIQAYCMFAMLARLLKELDFQQRIRFMNDTFRKCMSELLHFLVVMAFMLAFNAFVLHLTVGDQIERFSTMWAAYTSTFESLASGALIISGDLGSISHFWTFVDWLPIALAGYALPIVVIIWSALNFLLGIIGDAYAEVKDEFQGVKGIFEEGTELFAYYLLGKVFPPADADAQLHLFANSGVALDPDDDDDLMSAEDAVSDGEPSDEEELATSFEGMLNMMKENHRQMAQSLSEAQVDGSPSKVTAAAAIEEKLRIMESLHGICDDDAGDGNFIDVYRDTIEGFAEEDEDEEGKDLKPSLQRFVNTLWIEVQVLSSNMQDRAARQEVIRRRYEQLIDEVAPKIPRATVDFNTTDDE